MSFSSILFVFPVLRICKLNLYFHIILVIDLGIQNNYLEHLTRRNTHPKPAGKRVGANEGCGCESRNSAVEVDVDVIAAGEEEYG